MSTTITVNGFDVQVFDFKNNSYAYIPNEQAIAWSVAKTQAEGVFFEGVAGHLATVTSAEENGFIVENILPVVEAEGNNYAWLGGTDKEKEGTWKWITGETWNYQNWNVDRPYDNNTYNYLFVSTYNSLWYDLYDATSSNLNGYIIEFEGTGTPDDNIIGTDKNDTLDGGIGDDNIAGWVGNDSLLGGKGEDTLSGGLGNDILRGGDDNDDLLGGKGQDQLFGDAGDDVLNGGADNDTLDGGLGSNILIGGLGNDTYIIDSLEDIIVEKTNNGIDIIKASVSYTLDNNIENLTLTGTKDLTGSGNNLNNIITGNTGKNTLKGEDGNDKLLGGLGNDTLIGGLGKDTLTGGAGNDQFMFESKAQGVDTITDFNNTVDKIGIKASGFGGGLQAGNLTADKFVIGGVGTVASRAEERFIYNSDGKLFFDPDGNGFSPQIQIATFNNPPFLSNTNFVIV
jgi:Ca2+-binding RTX toxin-like protein